MADRSILQFPDPKLRQVAAQVTEFGPELGSLAEDLLRGMRAAPGIGITAPHVGVPMRLVVIELPGENLVRYYVNPRVTWASGDLARHEEGSVSMPGVSEEVERPVRVRVEFQDLAGAHHTEEAEGLLAVCLQHEIDQLDGVFWIQRVSRLKRDRVIRRYEKLRRRG